MALPLPQSFKIQSDRKYDSVKTNYELKMPVVEGLPSNATNVGDLIYNSLDGNVYVSNGTTWELINAQQPLVANYTVGPTGNFPTLTAALNTLRGVVIGDVTITIAPGSYTEDIDLAVS